MHAVSVALQKPIEAHNWSFRTFPKNTYKQKNITLISLGHKESVETAVKDASSVKANDGKQGMYHLKPNMYHV